MAEMLAGTSSSELVEWFAFLQMEDERLRGVSDGGDESGPEFVDAARARQLIGG